MSIQARDILRGDFHVHSSFSDDARSTIAENLAAAASNGITEIRLIDHVRASTTWVPQFLAEVANAPRHNGLMVRTGVEAKLLNALGELDIPSDLIVGPGGVDAIVIADHQFPGTDGAWSPDATREKMAAGLLAPDALELLICALVSAMESAPNSGGQPTAQLAHCFSILPKIGLSEDDLTDAQLERWATAAASTGTLIEVNEKWACPQPRSLRAAIAAGATLVASTDSHVATEVGEYDRVAQILGEVWP